jgi:hypothetical protein
MIGWNQSRKLALSQMYVTNCCTLLSAMQDSKQKIHEAPRLGKPRYKLNPSISEQWKEYHICGYCPGPCYACFSAFLEVASMDYVKYYVQGAKNCLKRCRESTEGMTVRNHWFMFMARWLRTGERPGSQDSFFFCKIQTPNIPAWHQADHIANRPKVSDTENTLDQGGSMFQLLRWGAEEDREAVRRYAEQACKFQV